MLDSQRAETSQQQSATATPQLDIQRAESSRQHVRALNKQFASWIQNQLENHPDELWDDGVQDYLNHTKTILEKFSDVVNWLKANAAKDESMPVVASDNSQKVFGFESKEKGNNLLFGKPGIPPVSTTTNFGASWGSGSFFNNQTPFSFGTPNPVQGSQISGSLNNDASKDADGEDDVEQPGSPSVEKAEEKGITVVHEVKCKLYVKSSDPADKGAWKDKGRGNLSIKCKDGIGKGTKESKPTIVVRNDVGKLLLNALLYPGIKTNMQKNAIVAIFHTSGDVDNSISVVARTFLIKTKNEEDRNKLAEVIKEYAPAA